MAPRLLFNALCISSLFICSFAEMKITFTDVIIPTEVTRKTIDVEATGSKVTMQLTKFRPHSPGEALPFISCTITNGNFDTAFEWAWANGSAIAHSQIGSQGSRVPKTGTLDTNMVTGKLTFSNTVEKGALSVGLFKCSAEGLVATPSVFSAPVVSLSDREYRSDLEGSVMTQLCTIVAYPQPKISWSKNNQTILVTSTRIQLSADNRTLTITDVLKSDAGLYTCKAENSHGIGEAYIRIRVKDRLAALWPFLGILAELLVLSVIIILYERKRAAKRHSDAAEEAANAAAHGDSAAKGYGAGGGGGGSGGRNANDSDLRHRPVRS